MKRRAIMAAAIALPTMAMGAGGSETIVIPTHNWSSQIVMSHVVGNILQKQGNTVRYVKTDSKEVFEMLRKGEVTLEVEVWEGVFGTLFTKAISDGGMVDAGAHAATTREEWWYPDFVEAKCPGLPDWKALNACAAKFATPETGGKGMFLAGPKDWPQHHQERIAALGMNFVMVHAASADALWNAITEAKKTNTPIVLQNWTPNFVEAIHSGKFVEFPPFRPDCNYACGAPVAGYLKKAAWSGMKTAWPKAFQTLTAMSFTNAQIAEMAKLVDVDHMEATAAADAWLARNEAVWKPWVK